MFLFLYLQLGSNRRGTDSPHIPSINCNNIGEFEGFAFMPYEEQINNNHVEAWRVTNNVDPTNYASSFLWHSYGPKEYVRWVAGRRKASYIFLMTD